MWPLPWPVCANTPADPVWDSRASGTDEVLVAAFKNGDARTFDALFARYRQPIFGYIYRSVGDPALAEELTQEVFLKAFPRLRQTAPDTIFKAWIYRIATTTCIDAHRAATRRPPLVRDAEAQALPAERAIADPEQHTIQDERQRAVRRTLDALPAQYRQALILRQLQDLTYAEIGEALGISVEAVTSLIHRARHAFRASYNRETER